MFTLQIKGDAESGLVNVRYDESYFPAFLCKFPAILCVIALIKSPSIGYLEMLCMFHP